MLGLASLSEDWVKEVERSTGRSLGEECFREGQTSAKARLVSSRNRKGVKVLGGVQPRGKGSRGGGQRQEEPDHLGRRKPRSRWDFTWSGWGARRTFWAAKWPNPSYILIEALRLLCWLLIGSTCQGWKQTAQIGIFCRIQVVVTRGRKSR